ncbi:uncharacterized protein LOC108590349 [Callithrix jacchus]
MVRLHSLWSAHLGRLRSPRPPAGSGLEGAWTPRCRAHTARVGRTPRGGLGGTEGRGGRPESLSRPPGTPPRPVPGAPARADILSPDRGRSGRTCAQRPEMQRGAAPCLRLWLCLGLLDGGSASSEPGPVGLRPGPGSFVPLLASPRRASWSQPTRTGDPGHPGPAPDLGAHFPTPGVRTSRRPESALAIAGLAGHPDQCVLCGVLRSAAALRRRLKRPHQPKRLCLRPVSLLHLGISLFCGQERSVWKCGFDSSSAHSLRAAILSCSYHAILNQVPGEDLLASERKKTTVHVQNPQCSFGGWSPEETQMSLGTPPVGWGQALLTPAGLPAWTLWNCSTRFSTAAWGQESGQCQDSGQEGCRGTLWALKAQSIDCHDKTRSLRRMMRGKEGEGQS